MADLAELDRAEVVKIAGANPITGLADYFMDVDINGNAKVLPATAGTVIAGTAASFSDLVGGQFNTALPTLTNTQQSAIQLDSSGRIITRPLTSADIVTAVQGTAAALSGKWPVQITDGTNTMPTMDVVARAGFQKITDGTNTAAVKAASTAPLATDPALVVTLSPNSSPLNYATGSGTISALNGAVVIVGGAAITWSLSGTWVGTLTTQAQSGDGQWWNVASLSNQSGLITNSTSINGVLEMNGAGWIQARLVATSWTSGTVTVTWNSTSGSHLLIPYSSNGANFNTYTTLTDSSQNPLGTTAASTAATATQEALVVALSPNSALPAGANNIGSVNQGTSPWVVKDQSDGPVTPGTAASFSQLMGGQFNSTLPTLTTGQQSALQVDNNGRILADITGSVSSTPSDLSGNGNITALNQTVVAVLHGCAAIVMSLQGTFSASIQLQATVDNGATWFNIQGIYAPSNAVSGIWSANAQIIISCGGYQQVRALCISYTSGTLSIYWDASAGSNFTWSYVYNETPTNLQTLDNAYSTSASYPSPFNVESLTPAPLNQDAFGNLQTRGPVLTDEGSLRDDFTGTSLLTTLTGTVEFSNGSTAVNGTGANLFTTQVGIGQYVRSNSDPETDFAQVGSVANNTSLMLDIPYAGANNTGATGIVSNWATTTGSGSLTVANSILTIASGTTSGNTTSITRDIDYLPISMTANLSISQRIANQTAIIGFVDDNDSNACVVQFTGTSNTTVNFITAFSSQATDIQTTAVTLPGGATTASSNVYVIDLSPAQATLTINGIVVAINTLHLPGPYEDLQLRASITQTATVTTTSLAIDNIYVENIDRVQIVADFSGEPFPVFGNLNSGQPDNNTAPIKIGGVYNTTVPSYSNGQRTDIQTDARGAVQVTLLDGSRATYSATSAIGFASATTATDIFTITGSASKTIRILRVAFSAQETTAGVANVLLIKRSAANTGGTSAAATAVPHDSNDVTASATVLSYTANPSALGAAVGTVRAARVFIPTTGTDVADFINEWDFGTNSEKAIVLRGTAQVLAINLNATTVTGGTWTCYVEWTEE